MRMPLPIRSVLLVVLVASAAVAHEDGTPITRLIMLSEHPADATHRVSVKGRIITMLRFEKAVDPGKTKMVGWEGRFEPLAVVRNKTR